MTFLNRRRPVLFIIQLALVVLIAGCTPTNSESDGEGSVPQTAELNVSVVPSEAGETSLSSGIYETGQELNIEATPNEGWQFSQWSGDTTSTENSLAFTLESDFSLTAEFSELQVNQYQLLVETNPSEGGTVNPANGAFEEGTEVEISATPSEGWTFAGWSNDLNSGENPVTVTMDSTIELTANFEAIMVDLNVTTDPSGGGTVDPASGTFQYGDNVEVTAIPNDGWEFIEWTGDRTSTANPLSLTIEEDVSLTAVFSEIPHYELTVSPSPSEGGSVNPVSGTYEAGTEVEISATANEHWTFVDWTGDISSTNNPETVTINSNTNVTANFKQMTRSFLDSVKVADSKNSSYLYFGMEEGASSGFEEFDRDAPPRPPQGSFYAELMIENYSLFKDIRPISQNTVQWELTFATEEGQGPITLSWQFSETQHIGDLRLVDDPQSPIVDIDMKTQTSHEVNAAVNTLYIISN